MNERLTLQDLIDVLSQKQGVTKKEAESFLRELVALITDAVSAKDFVRIKDFGTFKLVSVSARKSVDVNTGEPIEIPPHYKLSFSPEKSLRELVNRPFSHFESVLLNEEVEFDDLMTSPVPSDMSEPENQLTEELIVSQINSVSEIPPIIEIEEESVEPEILPQDTKDSDMITSQELMNIDDFADIEQDVVDKLLEVENVESQVENEVIQFNNDLSTEEEQKSDDSLSSDQDITDFLDKNKKDDSKLGVIIGVCAALVVIAAFCFWLFSKPGNEDITVAQNLNEVENVETVNQNQSDPTPDPIIDNVEDPVPDNNNIPTIVQNPEPVVNPVDNSGQANNPASNEVFKSTKIVLEKGETLRVLGKRYLGHPAFWVYIFEENSDVIKKPDAIYAGMQLKIPDAAKYGANPDDPKSIEKAVALQNQLFAKFSK